MVAASRHTPPQNEKEHHMTAPEIVIALIKVIHQTAKGNIDEIIVFRIPVC